MKNILRTVLIASLLVFTSCDEDLDINTDPNFPVEITPSLALASAQGSLVTVTGGELYNLGGFWAQYHTQAPSASQYENIDQYNLNTSYADRLWNELYAGCLNDLQFVLNESEQSGETGTYLIASVLKAYTFQILVDLFDAVPYTEALQGAENITPQLTPGQEVYSDLIVKIDEALARYAANPVESGVGSSDQIFNGDMENWIRFANSLKLKIYMRIAYTSQANPAAVNALIAQDNFITSDVAFANFTNATGKGNPFYEVQVAQTGLGPINNVASNTLHDFFTANSDPRLEAVYTPTGAGTFPSIAQGSGNEFNNTALSYARPNVGQLTPVFLMSYAESLFLRSEAAIRYAGGVNAKELYDQGVTESFATYAEFFGLEGGTALAGPLLASGGAYEYMPSSDIETAVRQVIIQKWAALAYVNNIEAYIETTRTKFPEVVEEGSQDYSIGNRIPSRISVFSGTTVPSTLFYPDDEVNRNPNVTQKTSLTENVWWDQKPE